MHHDQHSSRTLQLLWMLCSPFKVTLRWSFARQRLQHAGCIRVVIHQCTLIVHLSVRFVFLRDDSSTATAANFKHSQYIASTNQGRPYSRATGLYTYTSSHDPCKSLPMTEFCLRFHRRRTTTCTMSALAPHPHQLGTSATWSAGRAAMRLKALTRLVRSMSRAAWHVKWLPPPMLASCWM